MMNSSLYDNSDQLKNLFNIFSHLHMFLRLDNFQLFSAGVTMTPVNTFWFLCHLKMLGKDDIV